MAIISKRKRVLLAIGSVATLSQAFVVVPQVKVVSPSNLFLGRRDSSDVSQTSVSLGVKKSEDVAVERQGDKVSLLSRPFSPPPSKSVDDLSEGRFSLILAQTETILGPAAKALDESTDGWALTYADLTPETQGTPIGQAFLFSNIAYALAGLVLSAQGELLLGFIMELVSVASFIYHYTQLDPDSRDGDVRMALFIDYVLAFTSIFLGLGYLLMDGQLPGLDFLASSVAGGVFFLLGCTFCVDGIPYVVVHSLWHVFSAYCAFSIGIGHIEGASTMI